MSSKEDHLVSNSSAGVSLGHSARDNVTTTGTFEIQCYDKDGNLKWLDTIDNLVVNVGKNLMLDTIFTGSSFTAVGPYMGLVNASPAPTATDTMSSHGGWLEVGNANAPTYTSPRPTPSWSSATGGSKTTASAVIFSITSSGTVGGCFIVTGTGASSTIGSTTGTLFSCGAFTGGNKTVSAGDQINVTYSLSV
jgi:hypothetical protein